MTGKETATAAMALRKLVRAGSARQLSFALRDVALIVLVGVGAFFLAKPLGIAIIVLGIVLFVVFAVFVLTSGARLEKSVRDPGRIRSVVVAETTNRNSLARLWVVGLDNRTVTVPLLVTDASVAVAAIGCAVAAESIARFGDEATARAEVKRLSA